MREGDRLHAERQSEAALLTVVLRFRVVSLLGGEDRRVGGVCQLLVQLVLGAVALIRLPSCR